MGYNGVMDEQEIREVLAQRGAILTNGHFVYTSGKHGQAYVNKDAIYPRTGDTSRLCRTLANKFTGQDAGYNVQVVIGPAVGGVILAQWVAHHLTANNSREVLGVYAEKEGDVFVIKRGYDKLVADKNVLVVEDVLTTGGSVKKVVNAVCAVGGWVIGVGALCNRGNVTADDLDIPMLKALLNVPLEAWDEKDCPLCAQEIPINTNVGKGREFLARKQP